MLLYAEYGNLISAECVEDWRRACSLIERLPQSNDPRSILTTSWTCHGLARAFAKMADHWQVADGFFARRGINHSWLWRQVDGNAAILDIYPVGGIRPHLLSGDQMSPWRDVFIESSMSYRKADRDKWAGEANAALRAIKLAA